MVRKYENKTKAKAKPAKTTRTRKGKKVSQRASPQLFSSSASELDFTLPEGNHLDSFDQFRSNNIQVLKEKKVLKKDVRASFNRDSSIEVDSDATCSSFAMSISNSVPEDEENIDPSDASDLIPFTESINSINSFRFSKSIRKQRQLEKAMAKANEPKKPISLNVNIKNSMPRFRVSDYLLSQIKTSTPQKFFSKFDVSSIHHVATDESASNLPEDGESNHTDVNKKVLDKSESKRPKFVGTRRQKAILKEPLAISSIGHKPMQEIDNEIVDDAAAISIVSAMDMSSIAEWHAIEDNEKMCTIVSDDSFSLAKPKTAKANASESKQNKTDDIHDKTDECVSMNSFDFKRNDSSSSIDDSTTKHRITVNVEVHAEHAAIETISVSSTSTTTTLSTVSSPVIAKVNPTKLSVKPRVGFDASNSIYELSAISQQNESSLKLVMKGGKWRRTVFESRKNKVTQSPKRTMERLSNQQPRSSHARQSHANVLRRKSIFIKDIPDRKTINSRESQRKSNQQTVAVLDESDVESICSADFSPKQTPINVLSKLRSSRLQPIADSVDLVEHYQKSAFNLNTGSQLSLSNSSTSSSLESVVNEIEKSVASLHLGFNHDELKLQLLKRCKQTDVLPFDEIYSASVLKKCRKIGEGVFGEVFLNETSSRSSYVLKIIPIEGSDEINGAQQKRFDEILQEVIISQELSDLRHTDNNRTSGFVEVLNVRLVEGRYPAHLIDLWNDYDIRQGTENDCPDVFGDDQLYVVFELANCGSDLEAHVFKNAEQSFSIFKQVAISLAVAESEFEFEHRDLHWGNVLVAPTTETSLTFNLNGKSIEIRTYGIKATIIDYTLSRLVYKDCCLFQDLAADPELFDATGDYQYDVYRLMRTQTSNNWAFYEPFTNVLWLHYTIDKMIGGVNYTAKKGVKHRQFIDKMIKLRDELLEYRSASDYIETSY